ncbi:MAG: polysaccharide pyruvyl transferase family protein [Desulfatiglans sp.]|nr:polysaccharide pyruvyl transferase family protein [Desulfatiglans sp.]
MSNSLLFDSRIKFYDLSTLVKQQRVPKSKTIQFYSAVNNIGNYTPILGIRKIIQTHPDTWNIHDKNIDFKFINENYTHAIIGGAGLLHPCFSSFWRKYAEECRLPTVIWGVGICLPLYSTGWEKEDKKKVRAVFSQADLVNVRDEITVDYFDIKNANIGPCPTIAYLSDFLTYKHPSKHLLYSFHDEILSSDKSEILYKQIQTKTKSTVLRTDNIQYRFQGIQKILKKLYCKSSLVVSTRLHGAIFAYGLGIPYIVFPVDNKIIDFQKIYKNGLIIGIEEFDNIKDLDAICNNIKINEIRLDSVLNFGKLVKEWLTL